MTALAPTTPHPTELAALGDWRLFDLAALPNAELWSDKKLWTDTVYSARWAWGITPEPPTGTPERLRHRAAYHRILAAEMAVRAASPFGSLFPWGLGISRHLQQAAHLQNAADEMNATDHVVADLLATRRQRLHLHVVN